MMDTNSRQLNMRRIIALLVVLAVVLIGVWRYWCDDTQLMYQASNHDWTYLEMDGSRLGSGVSCRFACYDDSGNLLQICVRIPADYSLGDLREITIKIDDETDPDRTVYFDSHMFASYVIILVEDLDDWHQIELSRQSDTVVLTMAKSQ